MACIGCMMLQARRDMRNAEDPDAVSRRYLYGESYDKETCGTCDPHYERDHNGHVRLKLKAIEKA
jgi:hypothetical protein